jgi:hypothetical protein
MTSAAGNYGANPTPPPQITGPKDTPGPSAIKQILIQKGRDDKPAPIDAVPATNMPSLTPIPPKGAKPIISIGTPAPTTGTPAPTVNLPPKQVTPVANAIPPVTKPLAPRPSLQAPYAIDPATVPFATARLGPNYLQQVYARLKALYDCKINSAALYPG